MCFFATTSLVNKDLYIRSYSSGRDRRTDRQTDGRTDGLTKFSSLDRVCIPCSAVKMIRFLAPPSIRPIAQTYEAVKRTDELVLEEWKGK